MRTFYIDDDDDDDDDNNTLYTLETWFVSGICL